MLSDFSWDMTGYIPKHAVNPHGDGIIPYAAERIFQLEPEPPAVGNLNEYILHRKMRMIPDICLLPAIFCIPLKRIRQKKRSCGKNV